MLRDIQTEKKSKKIISVQQESSITYCEACIPVTKEGGWGSGTHLEGPQRMWTFKLTKQRKNLKIIKVFVSMVIFEGAEKSNQVSISSVTLKIYWFTSAHCWRPAPRAASRTSEVPILTRRPAAGRSLFSFLSEHAATGTSDSYWEGRWGRGAEREQGKASGAPGEPGACGTITWPAPTKRRVGERCFRKQKIRRSRLMHPGMMPLW